MAGDAPEVAGSRLRPLERRHETGMALYMEDTGEVHRSGVHIGTIVRLKRSRRFVYSEQGQVTKKVWNSAGELLDELFGRAGWR